MSPFLCRLLLVFISSLWTSAHRPCKQALSLAGIPHAGCKILGSQDCVCFTPIACLALLDGVCCRAERPSGPVRKPGTQGVWKADQGLGAHKDFVSEASGSSSVKQLFLSAPRNQGGEAYKEKFQVAAETPLSGDTNLCMTHFSHSTDEEFRLSPPTGRSVCWLAYDIRARKWESSNLNSGPWVQNPPCVYYAKFPLFFRFGHSNTSAWRQLLSASSSSAVSSAHAPQILGSFSSFLYRKGLVWKSPKQANTVWLWDLDSLLEKNQAVWEKQQRPHLCILLYGAENIWQIDPVGVINTHYFILFFVAYTPEPW